MLKPPVTNEDQKLGNNQDNILVEFGDYQCPHCGHAYPLLKKLFADLEGRFTFVFRNFPLAEAHPLATTAAMAAEAAAKQDKFWQMHDLVYENQSRLTTHLFVDFAESLGLDMKKFAADWKSQAILDKVESDFESGVRSGVNGTPTFFLNGERLSSYDGSYESLRDAIARG